MMTKHILALTASSLLALILTGCATQQADIAAVDQGLNTAQAVKSADLTGLLTQPLKIRETER
jgi:PBP1b-binding outer membrane lipoprotein LpoB